MPNGTLAAILQSIKSAPASNLHHPPRNEQPHDAEVGDGDQPRPYGSSRAPGYGERGRDIGAPWNDGGDAMQAIRLKALGAIIAVVAAVVAALGQPAAAQDKVRVGVFPTASSLPYFVAIDRGFQKFIDFSTSVGTLPEKVDITKYLQAY